MSKHKETEIIYQTIKKDIALPDEALAILGITMEDIDARMDVALKFMDREQAMKSILATWKTQTQ